MLAEQQIPEDETSQIIKQLERLQKFWYMIFDVSWRTAMGLIVLAGIARILASTSFMASYLIEADVAVIVLSCGVLTAIAFLFISTYYMTKFQNMETDLKMAHLRQLRQDEDKKEGVHARETASDA